MTRTTRQTKRNRNSRFDSGESNEVRVVNQKFASRRSLPKVSAKNEFQRAVISALNTKQVIIVLGSAGVGKSFMTMTYASDQLLNGKIDKITLSRPAVGMGNTIGLLKGGMREKYEPYLLPLVDVIRERHGKGFYETQLSSNNIEFTPLEYLRGRNFKGIAVVDEAQNMTKNEAYSVLTRLTDEGQLILLGDPTQTDIQGENGLVWVKEFIDNHNLHDLAVIITGNSNDIVRGEFCKRVVMAMEQDIAHNK